MKRKKPIARLTPIKENTPEAIILDIGRILSEAGVKKKEAHRALDRVRREIYRGKFLRPMVYSLHV